ncbi:extracellular solute-binding protein [Armatimonas sp.]|uniref:extracellular solute-binding protein n=1 Tax=Armatimonas sp. TaxID=1872638 RepID=UPI003753026E
MRILWCLLLVLWATMARAQTELIVLKVGGAYSTWGIPDPNSTAPFDRARRTVFEAFTKKHPEIKLERFTSLSIQGPAAESGILMAYAGGTAPDIVYVNMRLMRQYVGQGFLQPLDGLLEKYPDTLTRVHPNLKKELSVDGHVYSVPYAQFVQALYYRKDLFREVGLDPNRAPQTWDEFYTYCQKLYDEKKGQWGFTFPPSDGSWYWINFLYAAGGDVTRQNEKGQYVAAFNSDAGEKALAFYRKLMTTKGISTKSTTRAQDISTGKLAMWFSYQSDDLTNMNSFDLNPSLIGIAPLPKGPTGLRGNELNASMWGVNASVKEGKKLQACYDFVNFMASEAASRIRVQAYVENGLGQLVNPKELKKWGYEEFITVSARPWLESQEALFASGKPEPAGPNMAFIYKLLDEPLDQATLYPDRSIKQILSAAEQKVNSKLLNYADPATVAQRRTVANGIAGVILALLTVLLGRVFTQAWRGRKLATTSMAGSRLPLRTHLAAWAFMLPAVFSVALWAYFPLLKGMVMAFQDYRILGDSKWIGLDNFIEAATQETFWKGFYNAFAFTGWLLGLGFMLPIILALMLNEIPKGKVIYRVLYYLPAVTTSVIVAMLWKQFFDASPQGFANALLSVFHIEPQKWLQDPAQAKFAVVLPLIWAGAGPGSIIYLAALQGIPDEMYEAADLDGAGVLTKIWRITLPTLSPLIIINLVGATIGAFKIMEPVLVQTAGGPDYATHTIGLEIWYNAFMFLKFGYATAAAWMMGLVLVSLTIYQLKVLQNVKYSTAGR